MTLEQYVSAPGIGAIPGRAEKVATPEAGTKPETKAVKAKSFWAYAPFAGRLGSLPTNFVPTDMIISKLADLLGVADEKPIPPESKPPKVGHPLPRW